LPILAVLLAGAAWVARRTGARRRAFLFSLAAGVLLTLGLAACAGSGTVNPGTPVGGYTIVVTGTTGSGSNTTSHTMNLTLVVT
jgi:hypothetical protein